MKKNLVFTICFSLLFGLGAGLATTINNAFTPEDEYVFAMTDLRWNGGPGRWQDFPSEWQVALGEFQFAFTEYGTNGVLLTFEIVGSTFDTLKFKDFALVGFGDLLNTTPFYGWTPDPGKTPQSRFDAAFAFKDGVDWYAFAESLENMESDTDMYIRAHMQSLNGGGFNSDSLQTAVFTYTPGASFSDYPGGDDDPTATPEPGTLLLLGTGIAGLGLVARRKLGK